MKAFNLTISQLIRLMHEALNPYDRLAQRDALVDIADLLEGAELCADAPRGLFRFWGLREHGTVMARVNDFDDWERLVVERYKITFVPGKGWGIEKL